MHELGLTMHMMDIVKQAADENHVMRIRSIKVKVGEYSGVVPELIREAFKPVSKGTVAEGANLVFECVPVTVMCRTCGKSSRLKEHEFLCPCCGSENIEIRTGREFYIDSIEVDDS